MNIITPFDLVERFPPGRTLMFVGNAPSLLTEGLGHWIDSHDVVVRFNEAAMAAYAHDVGQRTSILVTNPYVEGRARPMLDKGACDMALVIAPMTRRGDRRAFADWIGDTPVLFTYAPDPGRVPVENPGGMTTGVAAVLLLTRLLKPSAVSITGFTMYLDDTAHTYWSGQTPAGVAKHDMEANARFMIAAANRGPKDAVTVTSDIAWLARRCGHPLSRWVEVKALADPRWRQ